MKKYFFIVLTLIFNFQGLFIFGQSSTEKAKAQIIILKSGALLIRLKTSANAINALKQAGRAEEADKIKQEQLIKNKDIAKAFSENIAFCKVYFFYSDHSDAIKNGDFGSLMNGSLETDSTFNSVNYLIGEFGTSPTNKLDGFIIEDRSLVQLESPFPSFIRTNKAGLKTRSYTEIAQELNNELEIFYNKIK